MTTYDYHGFRLEVCVEDVRARRSGYVAVVRVFRRDDPVAAFSPLRFGETGGHPFASEHDALAGGYGAARRIVDDLFGEDAR